MARVQNLFRAPKKHLPVEELSDVRALGDLGFEGGRMTVLTCVGHDEPRDATVTFDQFNIPSGPVARPAEVRTFCPAVGGWPNVSIAR